MKRTTLLVLALSVALQASSQLRNYNDAGTVKILSEKTTLKITPVDAKIEPDKNGAALVAAVGIIAPAVIDLVVKAVQEKVKKDALKYIGIYKATGSAEGFYKSPTYAALPGFTIKREIMLMDGTLKTAAEFSFVPEFSMDRTAFRLKLIPAGFTYDYSVAKLKAPYNYIDVAVEVKIKGLSVSAGNYKLTDLGTVIVNIPMVRPGTTYTVPADLYSGWIQLLPKSSFDKTGNKMDSVSKTTSTYNEVLRRQVSSLTEKVTSTTFAAKIPATPTLNSGLYEVEVTATETNPYKIRAEQKTALVDSTAESGTALLKALIEAVAPKPKEDK
ncbi:hypothetical protein D3C87_273770 [compost metagenome]